MHTRIVSRIGMVAFDGDDTLWRSQDFFDTAQAEFEALLAPYVDLADTQLHERLYAVEARNIGLFGYGVKGMALSMVEAAIEITDARVGVREIARILEIARGLLQHPVEVLPHVREAVQAVAARHPVVLITKGDLFHQERKVRDSGLADLFERIEIVSEKDPPTYARLLREFEVRAESFVMVGNSLRSDIAPVLDLGGWGVHVPYHTTWLHEREARIALRERMREIDGIAHLPRTIHDIERALNATGTAAE